MRKFITSGSPLFRRTGGELACTGRVFARTGRVFVRVNRGFVCAGRVFACALLVLSLCLAGCSAIHERDFDKVEQDTKSEPVSASVLSDKELYTRAKKETQNAEVNIYSSTTVTEKVVNNFMEKYPEFEGRIIYHEMGDESTYPGLVQSIESGSSEVDLLISHSDLVDELTDAGLAYNYFPLSYCDVVDDEYQMPTAFMLSSTLFMCNSSLGEINIGNVWELTEPEWAGRILMKNPLDEQVNMNFFSMMSSPECTERLRSAYKSYYGYDWQSGNYKTIADEWVFGFIANCDFSYGSNSDIMEQLAGSTESKIALVGYSKLRKLSSEERSNITVCALKGDIEGFCGFAFGTYATVARDTLCPYTCALFINYILNEEGFSGEGAWNNYSGYYSTNEAVDKETTSGDMNLDFWADKLVIEDSDYLYIQNSKIEDFTRSCIEARLDVGES